MAQTSDTIAAILAPLNTEERRQVCREFVNHRMARSKLFNKYRLRLIGTNQDIIDGMMGEMRNLVQQFFKGKGPFSTRRCDACNTTDPARQYDRAHDRDTSRPQVLMAALRRIRADEAEVNQKDVMKAFIQEHAEIPMWYLCKPCHRIYDQNVAPPLTHQLPKEAQPPPPATLP